MRLNRLYEIAKQAEQERFEKEMARLEEEHLSEQMNLIEIVKAYEEKRKDDEAKAEAARRAELNKRAEEERKTSNPVKTNPISNPPNKQHNFYLPNHFISFTSKHKHIYESRKLVQYINNLLQPAKFL